MPWIVREGRESGNVDPSRGRILLAVLAGYLPAVWTALLLCRAFELLLYGKPIRSRVYDAIEWQLTYLPLVFSPLFLPVAYWAASWALGGVKVTWWKLAIQFGALGALFAACATGGMPTLERGEILFVGASWAVGGALYGLLIWLVCIGPSGSEGGPR